MNVLRLDQELIINRIKELSNEYKETPDIENVEDIDELLTPERKVMLSDYQRLFEIGKSDEYFRMVSEGKINADAVYVYVIIDQFATKGSFHYPFLFWAPDIINAYLLRTLGYYDVQQMKKYSLSPAKNLKYIAAVELARVSGGYIAIEILQLDYVKNKLKLPEIINKVLGEEKSLTDEKYEEILWEFASQTPFYNYDYAEAGEVVEDYYYGITSLLNEVANIHDYYKRIYRPYRVCYHMKDWKKVNCNKLFPAVP